MWKARISMRKKRCASCGFGASSKNREYNWSKLTNALREACGVLGIAVNEILNLLQVGLAQI